ncbi:hypothetical protein [Reyranella sp.]|uniref:hypothetical protein n=1 Tax=Reyranella sp. TaxID=1929291 RepID=UPI003BACFB50
MTSDETIAQVHSDDVAVVRQLLGDALSAARDRWIPVNAIADALVQELIECAARGAEPGRMSAYLRGLATLIDKSTIPATAN